MADVFYSDDAITLWHGDCREIDLEADAIVTDPPYAKDQLHCWDALTDIAIKALPSGGWLATYSGETYLDEVVHRLRHPDLAYRWTLATFYEGGGDVLNRDDLTVLSEWKPILIYRRRPFGTARGPRGHWQKGERTRFRDVLRRGGRDKTAHPWAQPLGESMQLVDWFSRPDDVVLDPFAGSGTTLVAAKRLGRRAVGVELEERYCEEAAKRLAQGVLEVAP